VIMRLAMVGQWLRAAREHPASRSCTLRYATGISFVQLCWIGRLWLPGLVGFAVLVLAELAVRCGRSLPGSQPPGIPATSPNGTGCSPSSCSAR
jgi:low temperature requirement A protein (LtrA)